MSQPITIPFSMELVDGQKIKKTVEGIGDSHYLGNTFDFKLASTVTSVSSTRGSAISNGYLLQGIQWAKKMVDAGKARLKLIEICDTAVLPQGHKDYVIPYRTAYEDTWQASSEEYSAGNEIVWTEIDTAEGVQFTPVNANYGVAISNDAIRTNQINQVTYAQEELGYKKLTLVDTAVRTALLAATDSAVNVPGMMTVYGGNATDASDALDDGDTMTPELVKKARRLLMSDGLYYWTGNVWTKDTDTYTNIWEPTPQEPFALFIAPEQEESLLNESQFTSSAEYGDNRVILTGEIGTYVDVKVVNTTQMLSRTSADSGFDTNAHECLMVKAKKCSGLVWGRNPEVKVFDWPNADQVRMKLSLAYHAKVIYSDAIVRLIVTDI